MTLSGHVMEGLLYIFGGLVLLAGCALVFLGVIMAFRRRFPIAFRVALLLAISAQFPVLFWGCWGWGMIAAEHRLFSQLVAVSYYVLLPLLYVLFVWLSLAMQRRTGWTDVSRSVAAFMSLVISPFLHLQLLRLTELWIGK